jgi:hypothetical protein
VPHHALQDVLVAPAGNGLKFIALSDGRQSYQGQAALGGFSALDVNATTR